MIFNIDDRESRRFLMAGLIIVLLFGAAFSVTVLLLISAAKEEAAENFVGIAALIVSTAPEKTGLAADYLSGAVNPDALDRGIKLLNEYGIDSNSVYGITSFSRTLDTIPFIGGMFVCLAGFSVLIFTVFFLSGLFSRVDSVSAMAASAAEGKYRINPAGEYEGSLGRLSFQVKQTAHRLAEQAEEENRSKEVLKDFLSDVSHQLKTPLSAARMYTEILQRLEKSDEPEAYKKRSEFIRRSTVQLEKMEWLVKNLLIIARLEAGALPLNIKNISLPHTVSDAFETFLLRAEEEEKELLYRRPETDFTVPHDPKWIGEAAANLIKNGLDHTPRGGKVSVTVYCSELYAQITVEDTGPGIPYEELPRIFDRFYRGRTAHGDNGEGGSPGIGIGLSLAKAIAEAHGGTIGAQPKGTVLSVSGPDVPQTGAKFIITLPRLTKL